MKTKVSLAGPPTSPIYLWLLNEAVAFELRGLTVPSIINAPTDDVLSSEPYKLFVYSILLPETIRLPVKLVGPKTLALPLTSSEPVRCSVSIPDS